MNIIFFFLLNFISDSQLPKYCKCESTDSIEEAFKGSNLVVWGKVDSISYVSIKETMDNIKAETLENELKNSNVTLTVPSIRKVNLTAIKVFKGNKIEKHFTIFTPRQGSTCGFTWFEKGKEFIIYASSQSFVYSFISHEREHLKGYEKANTFWTSQCTNTGFYKKEEVAVLEKY